MQQPVGFKKIVAVSSDPISKIQQQLIIIFNQKPELSALILDSFSNSLKIFKNDSKIRDGFLESLVIPLEKITQLTPTNFLIKKAFKVCSILIENVPGLLIDPELNTTIKDLLLSRLSTTTNLLIDMMKDHKNFMKLGETDLVSEFLQVSQAIKNTLQTTNGDPAGLRWNPREENLWRWCRAMLEHTAHPDYKLILSLPNIEPSHKEEIITKFQTLFNIQTKTIMEIAFSDDAADNLRDKTLTEILVSIPFADPSILAKYRNDLSAYKNGMFLDYFNLAVQVWDSALYEFKELIGESLYQTIDLEFKEHYKEIMGSITYSLGMNLFPHEEGRTPDSINQHLPSNMMVKCFRFMEKALIMSLEQLYPELKIPETKQDFELKQRIIHMAQLIASIANSCTTIYRELREGDMTNVLFFIANERTLLELNTLGITFDDHFTCFQSKYTYSDNYFRWYGVQKDLLSLIQTKHFILNNILINILEISKKENEIFKLNMDDIQSNTLKVISEIEESRKTQNIDEMSILRCDMVSRELIRIKLIDDYVKKSILDSIVMSDCYDKIEFLIDSMKKRVFKLSSLEQQETTMVFIESWLDFFCMYLIFKHQTRGAI